MSIRISTKKCTRIDSKFGIASSIVFAIASAVCFGNQSVEAQTNESGGNQSGATYAQIDDSGLVIARAHDFVIKPGQALPSEGFEPLRTQQLAQPFAQPRPQGRALASEPSNLGQPTSRQSMQPNMLPPAGQPRVLEVGLTRPELGGNAQLGGGPEWQILQNPNGPHTAILFDPNRQVIAVYQINSETGAITLKSVRNVTWDLQIEDYNSNKPAPKDIRAMQP